MEQSVCCYVPHGARPVGLLPVLNKSKCGRKGNNVVAGGGSASSSKRPGGNQPASSSSTRTDGLADLGEWPWHVSLSVLLLLLLLLDDDVIPAAEKAVASGSAIMWEKIC